MAAAEAPAKKSDLGVRTASALVMVAIAGTALWLGGLVWSLFGVAIMLGVLWEWRCLAAGITANPVERGLWNAFGIFYVGFATWMLVWLRTRPDGLLEVLRLVGAVIAVDIGAFFAGRTFGGPKIAPKISPSKTWTGLIGGMVGASVVMLIPEGGVHAEDMPFGWRLLFGVISGSLLAVVAQAGDFFESWMKRRAGVKDSSALIPGHGGLFDRVDGLLAVMAVGGILLLASGGFSGIF
ncbi:MAG: phosphatidate cytidylyltransferase [Novosphingobium sp.]